MSGLSPTPSSASSSPTSSGASTASPPTVATVAPEVIAYVEKRITQLQGRQRCAASIGLAVIGFVLGIATATSSVSPEWGAAGASILAAGIALVHQFCPSSIA